MASARPKKGGFVEFLVGYYGISEEAFKKLDGEHRAALLNLQNERNNNENTRLVSVQLDQKKSPSSRSHRAAIVSNIPQQDPRLDTRHHLVQVLSNGKIGHLGRIFNGYGKQKNAVNQELIKKYARQLIDLSQQAKIEISDADTDTLGGKSPVTVDEPTINKLHIIAKELMYIACYELLDESGRLRSEINQLFSLDRLFQNTKVSVDQAKVDSKASVVLIDSKSDLIKDEKIFHLDAVKKSEEHLRHEVEYQIIWSYISQILIAEVTGSELTNKRSIDTTAVTDPFAELQQKLQPIFFNGEFTPFFYAAVEDARLYRSLTNELEQKPIKDVAYLVESDVIYAERSIPDFYFNNRQEFWKNYTNYLKSIPEHAEYEDLIAQIQKGMAVGTDEKKQQQSQSYQMTASLRARDNRSILNTFLGDLEDRAKEKQATTESIFLEIEKLISGFLSLPEKLELTLGDLLSDIQKHNPKLKGLFDELREIYKSILDQHEKSKEFFSDDPDGVIFKELNNKIQQWQREHPTLEQFSGESVDSAVIRQKHEAITANMIDMGFMGSSARSSEHDLVNHSDVELDDLSKHDVKADVSSSPAVDVKTNGTSVAVEKYATGKEIHPIVVVEKFRQPIYELEFKVVPHQAKLKGAAGIFAKAKIKSAIKERRESLSFIKSPENLEAMPVNRVVHYAPSLFAEIQKPSNEKLFTAARKMSDKEIKELVSSELEKISKQVLSKSDIKMNESIAEQGGKLSDLIKIAANLKKRFGITIPTDEKFLNSPIESFISMLGKSKIIENEISNILEKIIKFWCKSHDHAYEGTIKEKYMYAEKLKLLMNLVDVIDQAKQKIPPQNLRETIEKWLKTLVVPLVYADIYDPKKSRIAYRTYGEVLGIHRRLNLGTADALKIIVEALETLPKMSVDAKQSIAATVVADVKTSRGAAVSHSTSAATINAGLPATAAGNPVPLPVATSATISNGSNAHLDHKHGGKPKTKSGPIASSDASPPAPESASVTPGMKKSS